MLIAKAEMFTATRRRYHGLRVPSSLLRSIDHLNSCPNSRRSTRRFGRLQTPEPFDKVSRVTLSSRGRSRTYYGRKSQSSMTRTNAFTINFSATKISSWYTSPVRVPVFVEYQLLIPDLGPLIHAMHAYPEVAATWALLLERFHRSSIARDV